MRSNRRPAVCYGVCRSTCYNSSRSIVAAIGSDKALAVRVKACDRSVYSKECVVVTTFFVFGLVVNGRALNLNFAGTEVTLEVGTVVLCVPEAPLDVREKLEVLLGIAKVLYYDFVNLSIAVQRYEEGNFGLDAATCTFDLGITATMTALICIQLSLGGSPARRPDVTAIINIVVTSATEVERDIVITETGNTAKLSIFIEAVAAGSIRNQRKELLGAEVVNPRIRGSRGSNDIFFVRVIKITELHMFVLPFLIYLIVIVNTL